MVSTLLNPVIKSGSSRWQVEASHLSVLATTIFYYFLNISSNEITSSSRAWEFWASVYVNRGHQRQTRQNLPFNSNNCIQNYIHIGKHIKIKFKNPSITFGFNVMWINVLMKLLNVMSLNSFLMPQGVHKTE